MADTTTPHLQGALLVARPELLDPNFRQTVVLLASHDADGTLGFVLNRPTGRTLSDFIQDQAALEPFAQVPVFFGGPVATGQLLLAGLDWGGRGLRFRHNLSPDALLALMESTKASVRAFVGHSGWAKDQVDSELREGSWLVVPPERWLLDPEACPAAWPRILRTQGPWYRLMAGMPDDPSLN